MTLASNSTGNSIVLCVCVSASETFCTSEREVNGFAFISCLVREL